MDGNQLSLRVTRPIADALTSSTHSLRSPRRSFSLTRKVVSDFDMPGMNGMEFHAHLLLDQSTKDIPFVFMTGSADQALMQYANRCHIQLFSKNNLVKDLIGLLNDLK